MSCLLNSKIDVLSINNIFSVLIDVSLFYVMHEFKKSKDFFLIIFSNMGRNPFCTNTAFIFVQVS